MNVLLLIAVLLLGLVMIPFGMPGTWIIAGAALGYSILVPGSIGTFTIIMVAILAVIGEVIEFTLTAKYTKKYGGSRRASWGAIIGGMVGAFMGVPVPIIGSVIGAFIGAFVGAFVAEISRGTGGSGATRVATGALIGRALASAVKVGIGVAMSAWIVFSAIV
ncbi:MAG: hypothetical protein JWL61_4933 [Gemmatimonadetes bacterium]|nr:hypothetical protein [Gemmatimonadota bacterium]